MAGPTPEVMRELVRLMNGDIEPSDLDDEALLALAAAALAGRETLHDVTLTLKARGWTFAQIAERLGVVESTASRWARPLKMRRWRREPTDEQIDVENEGGET